MSLLEKAELWYEIKSGVGRNKVVEKVGARWKCFRKRMRKMAKWKRVNCWCVCLCKISYSIYPICLLPEWCTAVNKMPIRKYTRLWDKYWQLAELLEATPSEFTQRRAAGRLKDFSKEDLDKLARALFTDERNGMEIVVGSGGTGLERSFTTGKREGRRSWV